MLFHYKIVSLPSPDDTKQGMGSKFKCHDYSTIIDVDVYKGGYDNYYCKVFYTTPGETQVNEDKEVTILCVYENLFIDSSKKYPSDNPFDKKPPIVALPFDKYQFFKTVKIGTKDVPSRVFIYINEELSVTESRDNKIGEVLLNKLIPDEN
jgi:hypothetical protein